MSSPTTYFVFKNTSVNLHFSGLEHVPDEPGHRGPHGRHHCHAHQLGVCNHRYERWFRLCGRPHFLRESYLVLSITSIMSDATLYNMVSCILEMFAPLLRLDGGGNFGYNLVTPQIIYSPAHHRSFALPRGLYCFPKLHLGQES